jgi:uncharacterized phage infection (PIP) family protein YhgE
MRQETKETQTMSLFEHVREELQKSVNSVNALRDGLALQTHLASMEAKQSLENVQQSVNRVQQQTEHALQQVTQLMEQGADEAKLKVALAEMELNDAWAQFEQQLDAFGQAVDKHETNLKGKWDMLKLKTQLAHMEWRQGVNNLSDATTENIQQFTQQMSHSIKQFGDQLSSIFRNR